jgi:hypothetical protein
MPGLTSFRWSVFRQGDKSGEISVTTEEDLPAWIELELRTASGFYANWLFELSWLSGDEATMEEMTETVDEDDGDGAGGGAGGDLRSRLPGRGSGGGGGGMSGGNSSKTGGGS